MSEIKIEAGKYYKTRDGRKAFVAAVVSNPFGESPDYPISGFIEGLSCYLHWSANGVYYRHIHHDFDLVAEWCDPVTKEVMVYLGLNGNASFYSLDAIGSARVVLKEGVFAK